jgi:hypothetical protein
MKIVKNVNNISVDDQTVAQLEELLKHAKTGELKSLIFIDQYKDGKVGHGWSGKPDKRMIGEIEDVKFNIFSQMYFQVVE